MRLMTQGALFDYVDPCKSFNSNRVSSLEPWLLELRKTLLLEMESFLEVRLSLKILTFEFTKYLKTRLCWKSYTLVIVSHMYLPDKLRTFYSSPIPKEHCQTF